MAAAVEARVLLTECASLSLSLYTRAHTQTQRNTQTQTHMHAHIVNSVVYSQSSLLQPSRPDTHSHTHTLTHSVLVSTHPFVSVCFLAVCHPLLEALMVEEFISLLPQCHLSLLRCVRNSSNRSTIEVSLMESVAMDHSVSCAGSVLRLF